LAVPSLLILHYCDFPYTLLETPAPYLCPSMIGGLIHLEYIHGLTTLPCNRLITPYQDVAAQDFAPEANDLHQAASCLRWLWSCSVDQQIRCNL